MMRRFLIVTGFSTALALAGLITACNKSPSAPGPASPAPVRIEIVGPGSVPPGATAQFTAAGHLSDGSILDVTNAAKWSSSNGAVLSISQTGLATARVVGEANIQADVHLLRSTREVIVVPAGTYRLVGIVETASPWDYGGIGPIAGARVEVTAGPAVGLFSTTTGEDGRYRLYGVSGNTQILVTKDGYQPHVQNITVTDHQTQNIELTRLREEDSPNVSGTYRLTITAADDCRAKLPKEARIRTYSAVVVQEGPNLEATLTGATFAISRDRGNHFRGLVEPDHVAFSLMPGTPYDFYYGHGADVVEQLAPSTYLVVSGTVVTTLQAARLSGALDGLFQVFDRNPHECCDPAPIAVCRSARHQFVLSR